MAATTAGPTPEPPVIGPVNLGLQGLLLQIPLPYLVKLLLEPELRVLFTHLPDSHALRQLIAGHQVFAHQRMILQGRIFSYIGAHAIDLPGDRMIKFRAGIVVRRYARAAPERKKRRQQKKPDDHTDKDSSWNHQGESGMGTGPHPLGIVWLTP